jgi:FOG: GAF domain
MEEKLTAEQRERFFSEIKEKSDNIMKYAFIAYFGFGLFLAGFYNTFTIAFGVGGLSIAAYFFTKSVLPKSNLYQYVAAAVLAIFAAQFIYQMHGLFEMHFFVFIGTALLITYQNWKLQLPLIILVVIHHATFAWLQYKGNKEIYFTQLDYMDLQAFLFHGGLAAVISAICGYWAFDLEKKTETEALKTLVLENQLSNVKNNIAFANEISKGNLSVDYTLLDQSDELGKSLMGMRKSLVESSEREQEEKFITIGITKVGDIIRKNNDNVKVLAEEFISGIVKYLGINQGGVFLHEEEGREEYLNLVACYAYERKKFLNKRLDVGQGLIGQCFLEKDIIYMTKVPDEYVHITSGLGEATPGSVLLMPLMTNESIVGVMELASFKPFTTAQTEFIKRASENIASSIISSRITERVKRLLEESQQQAEEMKAQGRRDAPEHGGAASHTGGNGAQAE